MTCGSRKPPPISISSPRDTSTSLRSASVLRTSSNAAALLLTTVAAAAPVSRRSQGSTWSSRSPRRPVTRSNSRLEAPAATRAMASRACCGSGARPRFVCSTVPVRLKTERSDGAPSASTLAAMDSAMAPSSEASAPLSTGNETEGSRSIGHSGSARSCRNARSAASSARTASSTALRPCSATSAATDAQPSTRSTAGRCDAAAATGARLIGRARPVQEAESALSSWSSA